ncbi:MAG: hypothetical protein NTY77_02005 [Elusimicrobia bacterium]|nr:hypothetical protein [Elusimicrobiota bacterium]
MVLKVLIAGCLVALIGAALLSQSSPKKGSREFRVNLNSSQVFLGKEEPRLDTALEQKKSGSRAEFGARTGAEVDARPRLTVPDLVTAMSAVVATVPSYVPNLPFMTSLAQAMLANDPGSISFEPMAPDTLGYFTSSDPKHPRIALNSQLQDLYLRGLPIQYIVPVMVHELDHMLAYMQRRYWGHKNHPLEQEAFVTEVFYWYAWTHRFAGGGVVDARDEPEDPDPEVAAYKKEMARIRKAMKEGRLPELIRELYAPKTMGGETAGTKQRAR